MKNKLGKFMMAVVTAIIISLALITITVIIYGIITIISDQYTDLNGHKIDWDKGLIEGGGNILL